MIIFIILLFFMLFFLKKNEAIDFIALVHKIKFDKIIDAILITK
jgi:hypothetical protein